MVTMAFSLGGKRRPFTVSPNYAVGLPNGAAVTDAHGTAWRTTGGNQVSVNGVTDTSTSGVAKIVLASAQIWQTTPTGWYFKVFPSNAWTFNSPGLSSADMATINVGDVTSGLVDPRAFVWTLTAGGVIVVDGTPDAVTHDVTQLVYFGNQIWQNTIFGWYHKTLPTDAWVFSATAPGAAPSGNTPVLLGAQLGDPGNGDPSLYNSFFAAMGEGPSVFTTYAVPDPCGARDQNNNCIAAADWGPVIQWQNVANYSAHGINILNGYTGAKPITIPVVGISMAQFNGQFGFDSANEFAAIQSGSWDYRFDAIYQAYVDHGFTSIISRPGWEMNGNWEPWSVYGDNSNASAFAATFRHIATHAYNFASAHGITIKMCWNPGFTNGAGWPNFNTFWPGDAYVDHIGIDTYGLCSNVPDNSPLLTFPGDPNHFCLDDAIQMCVAKNKPLCFPETGVGVGETVFQQNLKTKMLQNPACKVSFVSIWDQPTGCGDDRGISAFWSTNANSSAAWKDTFNAIRNTNGPW